MNYRTQVRIASYNILDGGIGRADPMGEVLAAQNADVIVLVEADDAWVVERIAKRLNMDVITAAGEQHAVAVLSRFPIVVTVNHAALNLKGPRSWAEVHIGLPNEQTLVVMAIHLTARATVENEHRRLKEIDHVLAATKPLRAANRPHIIVGDFNSNAPQQRIDIARCKPATQKAYDHNGKVIPRFVVARMLGCGYVDSLAAARGDGAFDAATFTTHEPGQRVDYIFAHGIEVADAWVERDRLATYASDHYPIGAELLVPSPDAVPSPGMAGAG